MATAVTKNPLHIALKSIANSLNLPNSHILYWMEPSSRKIILHILPVDQRWLIVFSEAAYAREIKKTFERNLNKARDKAEKAFWHLCNTPFSCEADAQKEVTKYNRKTRYFSAKYRSEMKLKYQKEGRPLKNTTPEKQERYLSGQKTISIRLNRAAS